MGHNRLFFNPLRRICCEERLLRCPRNTCPAVRAIDNAGNIAAFTIEYEVRNPVGFEPIIESMNDFMSSYGFFVGAGSMVVVLGVGKLLLNRRAAGKAVKKGAKSKKNK